MDVENKDLEVTHIVQSMGCNKVLHGWGGTLWVDCCGKRIFWLNNDRKIWLRCSKDTKKGGSRGFWWK